MCLPELSTLLLCMEERGLKGFEEEGVISSYEVSVSSVTSFKHDGNIKDSKSSVTHFTNSYLHK